MIQNPTPEENKETFEQAPATFMRQRPHIVFCEITSYSTAVIPIGVAANI